MIGPEIEPIGPAETPVWIADQRATSRHAMFDSLVWRGLVLGSVENFGEGGLFYAWVGSVPRHEFGSFRLGGYLSLASAREAVRMNAEALLVATVGSGALSRKETA
jgi:hypothetical protein